MYIYVYGLLFTFFTAWALETRVTLAGVVPYSLHAVGMSTARILQTRGCRQKEIRLNRMDYVLKPHCFTFVTNGSLPLFTVLIVPLALAFPPLDVNLHTVLTGYVIWLHR